MKLHFSSTSRQLAIFTGEETITDATSTTSREALLKMENSMKLDLMRNLGSNYASKIVSIERLVDQWEMLQSVVIGDKHSRLERVKQILFRMK